MPDLEELYREIILDHYRSPRNRGELESPPAHRVEGFNPLCGDEVVVSLLVDGETLSDIKIAGSGCSISQSSASLMSAAVKGRPISDVQALIATFKRMMSVHGASLGSDVTDGHEHDRTAFPEGAEFGGDAADGARDDEDPLDLSKLGELAALQGVVKFPVRIKCATLCWNALYQGLEELRTADA